LSSTIPSQPGIIRTGSAVDQWQIDAEKRLNRLVEADVEAKIHRPV
jgi:hypothetical protein